MSRAMSIPAQPRPAEHEWADLSARLVRYAAALTGRRDDAEDLVQQTVARMLASAPDRGAHAGLARATLTRLWLDRQRSVRRRLARLLTLAATRPEAPSPGARAADMEQAGAVRNAIDRLPPRQRAVMAMRLVEGLGYAQIADALGCDVGAVRATLHVARAKVRAELGGGA